MTTTFRVTKGDEKFDVPKGIYRGKFLSAKVREANDKMLGRDGQPMEPGTEWQFQIEGDASGAPSPYNVRIATITTSQTPTLKNSCKRILEGIIGRALHENDEVDIKQYLGRVYQVCVDENKGGNYRVSAVYSLGLSGDPAHLTPTVPGVRQPPGANPAPAPANAQRAPVPTPPARSPRPAQPAPAAAPAQPEPSYWVQVGDAEPVLMTRSQVQVAVSTAPEGQEVDVMPEDQSEKWKPAREAGFVSTIPF